MPNAITKTPEPDAISPNHPWDDGGCCTHCREFQGHSKRCPLRPVPFQPMEVPPATGIVHVAKIDPAHNSEGFGWLAHVDRFRPFGTDRVNDDPAFTYGRMAHTPLDAFRVCVDAIRRDCGPTYRGLNFRMECPEAPDAGK